MFEILHIIFLNIISDRKFRVIIIFIVIATSYRFFKYFYILNLTNIYNAKFINIDQKNGAIKFNHHRNKKIAILPYEKFIIPSKKATNECEKEKWILYNKNIKNYLLKQEKLTLYLKSNNFFKIKKGYIYVSTEFELFEKLHEEKIILKENEKWICN